MAFMPPQGPQGPQQGPLSPPPTTIPNNLWPVPCVDPGAITGCLFRITYMAEIWAWLLVFRPSSAAPRSPVSDGREEDGSSRGSI